SACQSMVTRNTPIVGTMRVRVRLGLDGHVSRTRVMSNSTNNTELATCIQNSIRTWAYPRPEGGEVEFDYNFGFGS
ncbi:MAG: AgmX/PglI C-terminal domain-containing protein, partial [Deltaproteobacteria bacterium]